MLQSKALSIVILALLIGAFFVINGTDDTTSMIIKQCVVVFFFCLMVLWLFKMLMEFENKKQELIFRWIFNAGFALLVVDSITSLPVAMAIVLAISSIISLACIYSYKPVCNQ